MRHIMGGDWRACRPTTGAFTGRATTFAFHSFKEARDVFLHGVIDAKCDGRTACRADHFGCLFHRFRTIVRGAVGTHASSSARDHRTSFSERPSNAATCAACSAGNHCDGAGKRFFYRYRTSTRGRYMTDPSSPSRHPRNLQMRMISQLSGAHQYEIACWMEQSAGIRS
jgi:hypothetical protein